MNKKLDAVKLAQEGVSVAEIAARINSTPGSVKSMLARARREGHDLGLHCRQQTVKTTIDEVRMSRLREAAGQRTMTVTEIVAKLINNIIDDNLYDAVLEDVE